MIDAPTRTSASPRAMNTATAVTRCRSDSQAGMSPLMANGLPAIPEQSFRRQIRAQHRRMQADTIALNTVITLDPPCLSFLSYRCPTHTIVGILSPSFVACQDGKLLILTLCWAPVRRGGCGANPAEMGVPTHLPYARGLNLAGCLWFSGPEKSITRFLLGIPYTCKKVANLYNRIKPSPWATVRYLFHFSSPGASLS